MDIGKPQRVIIVEPLDVELPVEVAAEIEPVPSDDKTEAPISQRRHHPARVASAHPQPSRDN
jgi:hypothetical protein